MGNNSLLGHGFYSILWSNKLTCYTYCNLRGSCVPIFIHFTTSPALSYIQRNNWKWLIIYFFSGWCAIVVCGSNDMFLLENIFSGMFIHYSLKLKAPLIWIWWRHFVTDDRSKGVYKEESNIAIDSFAYVKPNPYQCL